MAKLVFLDQEFAGQVYDLIMEKTTVGRGDQNTLAIHHPSISSEHCQILVHGPEVIVCDLNSSNGTFVEGAKINKQSQVKPGQVVRFGTVAVRLEMDSPDSTGSGQRPHGDDATAITAVYALRQYQHHEEAEQTKPEPRKAAMAVGPATPPDSSGHTLILPRSSPPQQVVPSPTADKASGLRPKRVKGALILITLGLAAVLAFFCWRLLGHK